MDAPGTLPFDYAIAKPKRPVRVLALITMATCAFGMGFRWLGWILLSDLVRWLLGLIVGFVLTALLSQAFKHRFIGVPSDSTQMLSFGWMSSWIWCVEFGEMGAIVVGVILFGRRWTKMLKRNTIS